VSVKQVIVIRKDLHMRRGKEMAQASHASMKVFFSRMTFLEGKVFNANPHIQYFLTQFTPEMLGWLIWKEGEPGFTKIVVGCEGEVELKKIEALADEAGIPNAIILDDGTTEFHGVPTYTCIAVGPAESEKIDKITGEYKLL